VSTDLVFAFTARVSVGMPLEIGTPTPAARWRGLA
jgi:hypothetical protein